jgi:tetratricopeptide (TPR) repeat protein
MTFIDNSLKIIEYTIEECCDEANALEMLKSLNFKDVENKSEYFYLMAHCKNHFGNKQSALLYICQAIELDSTIAKYYDLRSLIYQNLECYSLAKDDAIKSIELDKENEGYKYNLKLINDCYFKNK